MSATPTPIFPQAGAIGTGTVATANAALVNPVSPVSILTAGANGTRLDYVQLTHLGTNVATVVRLFIYNGSTYALYKEATVPANTLSQVAASVAVTIPCGDVLPSGYSLFATTGTTIAAGILVAAFGGAY